MCDFYEWRHNLYNVLQPELVLFKNKSYLSTLLFVSRVIPYAVLVIHFFVFTRLVYLFCSYNQFFMEHQLKVIFCAHVHTRRWKLKFIFFFGNTQGQYYSIFKFYYYLVVVIVVCRSLLHIRKFYSINRNETKKQVRTKFER